MLSKEELREKIRKAREEYERSGVIHRRDLSRHIEKLEKLYRRMEVE